MKIKKKIIIPIVAVAVVAAAAIAVPNIVSGAGSKATEVSATPLAKMDLENIVSVTGTVKSEDATNVYSTLAYQVQSVNVEVGDRVNEGDILCVLDTESLSAKIDQQTASLANNQAKAQNSLAIAQNSLETEKFNQEKNYDTQLLNAEKGVETAEQALEARKSALENAKINLASAEHSQKANTKALRDYREAYGTPDSGDYDANYEQVYQASVQGGLKVTQAENAVLDAEKAVKDAEQGVKDAEATLKATQAQKAQAVITSQQQVRSAQLNANLSDVEMQIEELKKDLDNAIIKAPVSGTVTAVLATEGGNGQGLLFVIENTQKLMVTTKIKEYDIANVKVGQQAKVKSDGTGDDEYAGKVSKIAPTAVKAANGDTVETTDVQFATEVAILSVGELRIGMNARIDIVTEQKSDVFAVPFDAVVENENGESVVFVARTQDSETYAPAPVEMPKDEYDKLMSEGEEGQKKIEEIRNSQNAEREATGTPKINVKTKDSEPTMTAVAIPVTTGMETDFYIEIFSEQIKDGDLIISNSEGLVDGQEITLGGGMSGMAGARRGGGPGGGPGMAVRVG